MRVLVIGASGGTGRRLVEQALERGHDVTAFVRRPNRLTVAHDPTVTSGPKLQARLHTDSCLRALKRGIALEMATLRNSLRSLDSGAFSANAAAPRPGSLIQFSITVRLGRNDATASTACKSAFLALARLFIEYLDRLIALRRLSGSAIQLPVKMRTGPELSRHLAEVVEAKYQEVAHDTSLTNPKKLAEFPTLEKRVVDAAAALFALRRCLEHHCAVPQQDIELQLIKHTFLVGDEEVTHLPFDVGGKQLGIRFDPVVRVSPVGVPVELTEEVVELVYHTLDLLVGPKVQHAMADLP